MQRCMEVAEVASVNSPDRYQSWKLLMKANVSVNIVFTYHTILHKQRAYYN